MIPRPRTTGLLTDVDTREPKIFSGAPFHRKMIHATDA
jgi:hypothetical protein